MTGKEDNITLDRESFRSLASETRVSILKSLDRRRKMLTELSKEMGMSPSTVKEHMENLCNAGLAVMIDDGHKWKYYELSGKGKNILHPSETRIWILLSVSALAMIGAFYDMLSRSAVPVFSMAVQEAPMAGADSLERAAAPLVTEAAGTLPLAHIGIMLLFSALIGFCVAYLFFSRKKCFARV